MWTAPGKRCQSASDLLRNKAQQDVLLQLLGKLNTFDSPADLARKIDELAEAFTFDDGLGIADGLALAWSLRGLDIADVIRIEIPVRLRDDQRRAVGSPGDATIRPGTRRALSRSARSGRAFRGSANRARSGLCRHGHLRSRARAARREAARAAK